MRAAGVIVGATHQPIRLAAQFLPERRVVPGRTGDEVLQLIVARQPEARCHRLKALAIPRPEQATQVERRLGPTGHAPHHHQEWRQPRIELVCLLAILIHYCLPNHPRRQHVATLQSAQVVLVV